MPNRHLAVRAELVSRVAWQIRTRAAVAPDSVYVYAWRPVAKAVLGLDDDALQEVYADLASHAPVLGGVLRGDEDHSVSASDARQTPALLAALRRYQPAALSARLFDVPSTAPASPDASWHATFRRTLGEFDFVALTMLSSAAGSAP